MSKRQIVEFDHAEQIVRQIDPDCLHSAVVLLMAVPEKARDGWTIQGPLPQAAGEMYMLSGREGSGVTLAIVPASGTVCSFEEFMASV